MNVVIHHQNILMVNNRTRSGQLLTIEMVKIHYQNVHFKCPFTCVLCQFPQNIYIFTL